MSLLVNLQGKSGSYRTSLCVAPAVLETLSSLSSQGVGHCLTLEQDCFFYFIFGLFLMRMCECTLVVSLRLSHAESHVMM